MRPLARRLAVAVMLTVPLSSLPLRAQWPQFRGPDGTGNSSSKNLPLTWGEGKNVRWKTAVHGRAWSSPVILGNQVWMTTATEDGRELFAVALDRDTGKLAAPTCPRVTNEAFLTGTEPLEICALHRW